MSTRIFTPTEQITVATTDPVSRKNEIDMGLQRIGKARKLRANGPHAHQHPNAVVVVGQNGATLIVQCGDRPSVKQVADMLNACGLIETNRAYGMLLGGYRDLVVYPEDGDVKIQLVI